MEKNIKNRIWMCNLRIEVKKDRSKKDKSKKVKAKKSKQKNESKKIKV